MKKWKHTTTFVPLDVPPMYHVEITAGQPYVRDFACQDADVRVRLQYRAIERALLPALLEATRGAFPGARRLEIQPVLMPERGIRAPEVVAARTFDAKLQAWATLTGTTWDGPLQQYAQALQATEDGAAVARDVEARLRPLADVTSLEARFQSREIQKEAV